MDVIKLISDNTQPTIILACLVIGYCIKHAPKLERMPNQYIPTVLAVIGGALAAIIKLYNGNSASADDIIYGACAGLCATGSHEAFKQLIERGRVDGSAPDDS